MAGLAGVGAFLLFGLVRNGMSSSEIFAEGGIFGRASEFECLFANVYDVQSRKAIGEIDLSPEILWTCDFAALIPQQIAPFAKVNPAEWYAHRFFPAAAEQGHAFAFGTLAEAMAGWGWPDLVARSVCIGLTLAAIHRYAAKRSDSYWAFIFYIWATAWAYQLFRASSFLLLPMFVYQFLPVLVAVNLLAAVQHARSMPKRFRQVA
jgi:hypothetical protein